MRSFDWRKEKERKRKKRKEKREKERERKGKHSLNGSTKIKSHKQIKKIYVLLFHKNSFTFKKFCNQFQRLPDNYLINERGLN